MSYPKPATPGVELWGEIFRLRTHFRPRELARARLAFARVDDDEATVRAAGEVFDICLRPVRRRGPRASAVLAERYAEGHCTIDGLRDLAGAVAELMRTTREAA